MIKDIRKSEKAEQYKTTIIIGNQDIDLNAYDLTNPEKEYIRLSISNKIHTIPVNKYGYWFIFQLVEDNKSVYSTHEVLRKAAYQIYQHLAKHKITEVQIIEAKGIQDKLPIFAEALVLSNYKFIKYFSHQTEKEFTLHSVTLVSRNLSTSQLEEIITLTEAVYHTRDLVNEPASYLTTSKFSEEIARLGKESGFQVEKLDKPQIASLKMGGILAVNKGSIDPPAFLILTWKPANAVNTHPYILVGKGIVYDSGGLSLKPTPDSMDYMKCDMAGGAAVTGVMYALAKNNIPCYTIALIPITDNRLDANSYAPGDIITMYNGSTVEVLNTDAEGRLILADALAFAKKYEPALVISIATLTGAAQRAIGEAGMVGMGNADEQQMSRLEDAGWEVYERIARMPFWDEYTEMIKSDIADLKNIGGDAAGAITAGKFLEHFTNYPFIHLDIAGVAFLKKGNTYRGKGATGAGVRLLYTFLKHLTN